MVNDEQVNLLRQKMNEGNTQQTAAAIAGMSVRSARKWRKRWRKRGRGANHVGAR